MNSAKDAAKAQEEFNKSVANGANVEREGAKDSLRRLEELELAKAKRRGATEEEIFAITDKFARLNIRAQERYYQEVKGISKVGDEAEKDLKNLKAKRDTDLINNETTLIIKGKEKQTKANQEALAQQEKDFDDFIAKNEKKILRLNELSKSGKSEFEKKLIELKSQYDADLLLFTDSESAKLIAKKSFDEAVFKATKDEKKRISELEDKEAEDKIKKLDKERDKKIADDLKTKSMITKAMDQSIAITKGQAEAGVKIAEEESKGKIAAAQGTADTLAGLANLLGTETAAGKAAAVASATISAILSAQKAYESTIGIPFVGPVLAPINAGLALASGYKSIQSILSVQVPGQSGGGSAPGLPSAPDAGAGAPIAPRAAEPTATTLDSKSLNTISNVVSRAYVVESDITGSQQRISRIEKAARF
jgi:uncharacterized protein YacL (UPF0231 family)